MTSSPEFTTPEPALASQPAAQPPKTRPTALIVAAVAAGVVVLLATAIAITAAVVGGDAKSVAPAVPVIENIPRPNVACTPAADKKIGLDEDLAKIQWFGWLDGKQADMPVGQALAQRLAGHEVRDAWYCPPRADW